jgi:hypothetical protein
LKAKNEIKLITNDEIIVIKTWNWVSFN